MGVKNDRLVPAQHGASNNDEGALMPAVASSSMARYIISTSRLLPRTNGWHCSKWRTLCSLSECTSCATPFGYSSFIILSHCKLVLNLFIINLLFTSQPQGCHLRIDGFSVVIDAVIRVCPDLTYSLNSGLTHLRIFPTSWYCW